MFFYLCFHFLWELFISTLVCPSLLKSQYKSQYFICDSIQLILSRMKLEVMVHLVTKNIWCIKGLTLICHVCQIWHDKWQYEICESIWNMGHVWFSLPLSTNMKFIQYRAWYLTLRVKWGPKWVKITLKTSYLLNLNHIK